MTALIGSPETKRMMQTAEMQQPEGQTPTTVFDGLVGNGGAVGGTCWSSICMLEGPIQGLLLTGMLTGRAHLTSSNSTTRSYYHWSVLHAEEAVNLHCSFLFQKKKKSMNLMGFFPSSLSSSDTTVRMLLSQLLQLCFFPPCLSDKHFCEWKLFYLCVSWLTPVSVNFWMELRSRTRQGIKLCGAELPPRFPEVTDCSFGSEILAKLEFTQHWLGWLLPDNSIFHKLRCSLAARGDCVCPGSDSRLGVGRIPSPTASDILMTQVKSVILCVEWWTCDLIRVYFTPAGTDSSSIYKPV